LKYIINLIIPLCCCFYFAYSAFNISPVKNKNEFVPLTTYGAMLTDEEIQENYISQNQLKLDILHYDIDITLMPEIKNVQGIVTITGLFKEKGINTIDLNFYDNLKISEALVNEIKADFVNSGSRLTITLPQKFSADTFKLKISYSGKPKNLGLSSFVFGEINNKSLVYSLNEPNYASTWFPCNDNPADKALLDIKITNDSSRVSVSNGKLISITNNKDKKTYHWKTIYPISTYLICVFSSEYSEFGEKYISAENDTLDLMYYSLPEHRKQAEKDFEDHPKFLNVFSELFGPYPFMKEKYGVAEFLWQMGAMENQTITGIGSNLVNGRKFFNDIYIHELAHHWWGNAVSPASWKDVWLNEGFATYSEALYFEKVSGFSSLKSTMNSKYNRYFRERLYDTDGDLFSRTIYNKGAWVLHMLRKEMGDSSFFAMLKGYFEKFKYKNASTNDLLEICEKYSGKDLQVFFKQWVFEGTGIIECMYNWNVKKTDDTYKLKLNFNQFQKEYAAYNFQVDVKFVFDDEAKNITKTIRIDEKEKSFEFGFNDKPVKVIIDPDGWLLAYFTASSATEN